MFYSLDEITSVCDGYFFYKTGDEVFSQEYKLSFVAEVMDENSIFIPLKMFVNGDDWDTYGYIEKAMQCGAAGFIFGEGLFPSEDHKKILFDIIEKYKDKLKFVIIVKHSSRDALEKLAIYTRNSKIPPETKIIAITGTMGKTSTTEMVNSILSQSHTCYRGKRVVNVRYIINHKFLELDKAYDYMVIECSGAVKGYLQYFSELLRPDGAIITKIAIENITVYSSLIDIARNKASIMHSMSENSVAVIDDDFYLKEPSSWYKPKKIFTSGDNYELISMEKTGSKFKYKGVEYSLPVVGCHQIENAIKAIELTTALGIKSKDIVKGLSEFEQSAFRWEVESYKSVREEGSVDFITDCPNPPNYDNIMSNIKIFFDLYKDTPYKRIALSKIENLAHYEYEIYDKIAKHLIERKFDEIVFVGEGCNQMIDYLKKHSNIKITCFDHIKKLDRDEPLIKYLIDTLDKPQAFLFKTRMHINGCAYGLVRNVIKEALKDRLIENK